MDGIGYNYDDGYDYANGGNHFYDIYCFYAEKMMKLVSICDWVMMKFPYNWMDSLLQMINLVLHYC